MLWSSSSTTGSTGYGEAQPQDHYGETVESAGRSSTRPAPLLGDDPFALEEIGSRLAELPGEHGGQGGHRRGPARPLRQARRPAGLAPARPRRAAARRPRGRSGSAIRTTWPRRAEQVGDGFRRLKLKLGGRDGLDVERVRAVRGVTDLPLQVDVNEYWELDEALDAIRELAGARRRVRRAAAAGAGDPGGPQLKRRSPLPIYVDEDCHTLADVARVRRAGARDQHQARQERAASARPSGWPTPPARSAWASCSAA